MQTSKISQSVNYAVLAILGVVLVWFALTTAMARGQGDASRKIQQSPAVMVSSPIIKPLPAELQAEFRAAQDQVSTLQAQLNAATLRGQNVLYRAALELKMTSQEAETCEVKQVVRDKGGPVWSFICPAPELVQTPAPTATPKKQ